MWQPIELLDLYDRINRGDAAMDHAARRLWNAVCVDPQKWKLHPWGDQGGGFWVVGVVGCHAIWFNDIEDGFNISRYDVFGTLAEYWCNQDELNHTIVSVRSLIDDGSGGGRWGPQVYPGQSGDT